MVSKQSTYLFCLWFEPNTVCYVLCIIST